MWRWIVVAALAAGGCKDKGAEPSADEGPRAESLAGHVGSGSETAAEPSSASSAPVAGARSSIAGGEARAWLAGRPRGKRIEGAKVPAKVAAELVELGRPLIGAGDRGARPRLRWAKVMSQTALAFSIGYLDEADRRVLIFSVAIAAGDRLVARSSQEIRLDSERDREMRFAVDTDVDGDKVRDTVVTYATGWSGGGHSHSGGMILLGSRSGSTLDVQTTESDADYDGDDQTERDWVTEIQCWTAIAETPVLLVGGYAREALGDTEVVRRDLAAYAADDAGVLDQRAISGRVIAAGALEALEKRRGKGDVRLQGADAFEAPPCSPPPLVLPDGEGRFRLVSDLAIGAPAPGSGRVALVALPGSR